MSTWKGISHARMTRSMHALRGGEYKVLAAVRRLVPDGERRKLSQADIARRAGVSEGTVSEAMKQLDGPYLRRHFLGRGRGRGYEIEVLPPPEQQPPPPLDTSRKGSESDPCNRSFLDSSQMPQTPQQEGSESDPSPLLDHAHEQQQQPGGAFTQAEPGVSGQTAQLAPETIAALAARGAHSKLIRRVAERFPGLTPEQVAAAYAVIQERATRRPIESVEGLLFEILADGQLPYAPRPRPEPPPAEQAPRRRGRATPPREGFSPTDARAAIEQLGGAVNAAPASPPPHPDGSGQARASPRPDRRLRQLWSAALGLLKGQMPAGEFDTWLRRLELAALDAGVATLIAPSADLADEAERRHGATIRRVLGDLLGAPIQLRVAATATAAEPGGAR